MSDESTPASAWPTEIRLVADRRTLVVAFDDGHSVALPAELLRVESPSAEVQGHGPGEKVLVSGKRNVAIVAVEPVGTYAVKLVFDDGHSTGIYSWRLLRELGGAQTDAMRNYEAALRQAGLAR